MKSVTINDRMQRALARYNADAAMRHSNHLASMVGGRGGRGGSNMYGASTLNICRSRAVKSKIAMPRAIPQGTIFWDAAEEDDEEENFGGI